MIILEEIPPFFSGEKGLDEVVGIIQSYLTLLFCKLNAEIVMHIPSGDGITVISNKPILFIDIPETEID